MAEMLQANPLVYSLAKMGLEPVLVAATSHSGQILYKHDQ
jgi:hypothetical protein